jgi:hypothetical protein
MPETAAGAIQEAVDALGYFRADSIDDLIAIFRQIWPMGLSANALIYNDLEEMTAEQKRAHDLAPGRVPYAVWEILTEKGRRDVRHACKATLLRILFNLRRREFDDQEERWSAFASRVCLRGITDHSWHFVRTFEGTTLPREKRFALPLDPCNSEWCACRWDYVG